MEKICPVCGNKRFIFSWQDRCYQCRDEEYRREIVEQITSGEITETYCESEIFCPCCGYIYEIDDEYDLYCEGDHELECPECERDFVVTTNVSYSYDTKQREAL